MEHTGDQAGGAAGLSRRAMLKRGAVLGGAAVWMTPAMEVLGVGRRFAQAASGGPPPTTPPTNPPTTTTTVAGGAGGRGISFVAFKFLCNGTAYFVKLEGDTLASCEGPNRGQNCGVDQSGTVSGCGRGLFTSVNTLTGGEPTKVVVTLSCPGGTFVSAMAKAGRTCFGPSISGNVATFVS